MIKYNEKTSEFHLMTKDTSYILKVLPSKHLVKLHYGKRIKHRDSFDTLFQNYQIPLGSSTIYSENHPKLNLDTTMLEVGTLGKGDYRHPSLQVIYEDRTRTNDFVYEQHEILRKKPDLEGLPSSHGTDIQTLRITLIEKVKGLKIHLMYSVFYEANVITRSTLLENSTKENVEIDSIMSCNIDFESDDFTLLTLEGKWAGEGHIQESDLNKGIFVIDSKKGVSSANHNPFMCLKASDASEHQGEVYGFSLIYSGNHKGLVEVSPQKMTRLQVGINDVDYKWFLKPNEQFQTPEAIMTYSDAGLNGMSSNFHLFINKHLIRTEWQFKSRPILFNNWEGTYFDFNEKKLLALGKTAKELGIELFVLDDGWFGKRDDDHSSLGDFHVNKKKLPGGLERISKKIKGLGLDFGIWVEPEMISVDSNLYRKHPEWAIKHLDRQPSFGRNQLILDLTNPDVIDYLFESLSKVFEDSKANYVKWDMNRNFSDAYSNYLSSEQQESFNHRYVLGLYALLERITKAFPNILFESCSSGGNRFDLGMLYYMPQTWTSDDTDAFERQMIQYGMSLLYPLSTIGAHVSGEPSHQVLRNTPLETRFNVAAFGLLGYELDLTKLTEFEKKVIKKQIEYYKKHRRLFQYGQFTRLQSPFESNYTQWMVKSDDQAILGYYQTLQEVSHGFESIKIKNLNPQKYYHIENRVQFENIRRFGNLINRAIPINLKANSLVHTAISNRYMFQLETQSIDVPGDELLYIGFKPYPQFIGTGLDDQIRFIGDFGSRLYNINEVTTSKGKV